MNKLKKGLLYTAIALLVLIIGGISSVFLFKDRIIQEFVNEANKLKLELPIADNATIWKTVAETLTTLLAPYAPHITEELWADLGHDSSVHTAPTSKRETNLVIKGPPPFGIIRRNTCALGL